jgi:hypothetical protein
MRWIEASNVSLQLAACSSKARPRVACRRTAALFWLLSPRARYGDSLQSIPSTSAKRERVRAAESADGPQPYIHLCSIENNPESDYPSASCVLHF